MKWSVFLILFLVSLCKASVLFTHLEYDSTKPQKNDCTSLIQEVYEFCFNNSQLITRYEEHKDHVNSNNKFVGDISISRRNYTLFCKEFEENEIGLIAGFGMFKNIAEMLKCISSAIEKIQLSNNFVGNLNKIEYWRFTHLKQLGLSNTSLPSFDFGMLQNPGKLRRLDISQNYRIDVENIQLLKNYVKLTEFSISENGLQNIPDLIQYLPSSIIELNLCGNYIGKLNSTTFENLTSLNLLYLRNTSLILADFSPFDKVKNVYHLEISNNNLEQTDFSIPSKTIFQLEVFIADNCHIQNASDVVQRLGPYLLRLSLSNNPLTMLKPNIFEKLGSLSHLDLSNTNLIRFSFAVLQPTCVTFLNISYTNILYQFEPREDVDLKTKLVDLDFRGNNLMTLDNIRPYLPNLRNIGFSQNKFFCEYLKQIKLNWQIDVIDDLWKQQPGYCQNFNLNKVE